jgi:hydrogenase maturation protease
VTGPSDRDEGARTPPVLVLGIGSELRSDDAVGRHVAARVEAALDDAARPDVEVIVAHQLVPEHAALVADRRLVVVVDAAVTVDRVHVTPIDARAGDGAMSHHLDVAAVVGLSTMLGRPPQRVVTVAVPARCLDLGTGLSPRAETDVVVATDRVLDLVTETLATAPPPTTGHPQQVAG